MKFISCAAVALASATLAGVAHAATVIYDFSGTCTTDCAGKGIGQLTLSGYTPGDPNGLQHSNFVSFSYTSNYLGTVVIGGASPITYQNDLSGSLGTATGPYNVMFSGKSITSVGPTVTSSATPAVSVPVFNDYAFSSSTTGAWSFTDNGSNLDAGNNGIWSLEGAAVSAAPEPATWALMLAGVGAVGGAVQMGRRRKASLAG